MGWLGELVCWRIRERDLHGIELDASKVARAREFLPQADLRVGAATELPWPDASFRLVITSTLFTSILDLRVRRRVAQEVVRVMVPSGALLWYDFAFDNPRNPHVRGIAYTFPTRF
ncbi:MAG: class I SAM-dependent methyltransferase [Pseudomonadota bacterium]|nr:class I SAM-dependent methyltransferase [Pseudomonadota bacterium]